jgi:hypothetical protein
MECLSSECCQKAPRRKQTDGRVCPQGGWGSLSPGPLGLGITHMAQVGPPFSTQEERTQGERL